MSANPTDFARALREAGLRVTQQRMALLSILMDAADHPNADELLARARDLDDSMSLATVYRTLSALVEAGLIRKLSLEGESASRRRTIGITRYPASASSWNCSRLGQVAPHFRCLTLHSLIFAPLLTTRCLVS